MIEERPAGPETKVCRNCKVEKPASEFYPKRYRGVAGELRTYLNPICKSCFAEETKSWGKQNPEKRRAICRNYQRKKKFGIDSAEYLRMCERQNFACAICGDSDLKRRLDIDHSHTTRNNRELLCTNCNNGLGRFKDKPDLLRKAAEYLEKHADKKDFGTWLKENSSVVVNKFVAVM